MPEEPIQTTKKVTDDVVQPTPMPAEPSQPTPPPPAPQPEETVESLKEKLSHSARENQLLRDAETARKQAEQELTKEPTDSDLMAAFPEWDTLTEFEKRIARQSFNAERTALASKKQADAQAQERAWNTSIELVISSDPALEGKEQAFRQYAQQPKYRGIPMDVLKAAFLGTSTSQPAPAPTPKPGLEPGNGGPRTTDKPKLLSADDLATLRKTNEKAYMEYVKTHDINVDNLA